MLEQIKSTVSEHSEKFNAVMNKALETDNEYIETIVHYIFANRGKQMRPLLVLLTAAATGGVTEKSYIGATLVEIVHTASLVHDDIVDEAFMRRGQMSVNALWRSKIAVLAGDFLLSRALNVAAKNNAEDLLGYILSALEELCKGELIQQEHIAQLDMNENLYFEIIEKKTASLLGACGAIGAKSSGVDAQTVERMKTLGKSIGVAFQIKDDILDYQQSAQTGKICFNDLRERKITLPLLMLIEESSEKTKKEIYNLLSRAPHDEKCVEKLAAMVLKSDAIEKTQLKMKHFENRALEIINSLEDSKYKDAMKMYCQYILNREA